MDDTAVLGYDSGGHEFEYGELLEPRGLIVEKRMLHKLPSIIVDILIIFLPQCLSVCVVMYVICCLNVAVSLWG